MGAFGWVIVIVGILGVVVAVATLFAGRGMYDSIGKGDFALDIPDVDPGPPPGSAAARAEAEVEIRQLVEAKSARRERRGEAPLDVEAEVAALTGARPPGGDEALREEVRQVVVARNERRARRGQQPLDVEAEVDRQLRDLGA